MLALDALRLVARRWMVMLVGVAATVSGCVAAFSEVAVRYQTSSQMLLILPAEATDPAPPTNPFLNLQEGLTTTASLVAGELSTKDTHDEFVAAGHTGEYTIGVTPGAGPLLTITVTDTDPETAMLTRDEVMRRADLAIAELQSTVAVPDQQVITATRTSVGRTPEAKSGQRYKAAIFAGGAGLLLTIVCALAVDRLRSRRPRKARPPTQAGYVAAAMHAEPSHVPAGGAGRMTKQRASRTVPVARGRSDAPGDPPLVIKSKRGAGTAPPRPATRIATPPLLVKVRKPSRSKTPAAPS